MTQHFAKQEVAKSFGDAASEYDAYARIQHLLAEELLALCPEFSATDILDLGCGTGYCLPMLNTKYKSATLVGADLSQGMLDHAAQHFPQFEYAQADAEALPFSAEQFDLVFSNLAVQWCDDIANVLSQVYRVLKPGGYFVFTNLADGTLKELKNAWASVDQFQHVNEFPTGDELLNKNQSSEFEIESYAVHERTQYYSDLRALTDSLKRIGAHNITQGRSKGLTSRKVIRGFSEAMESFRTEQGLPASYQVAFSVLRKV